MKQIIEKSYTFDDVLIKPSFSKVPSRKVVNTSTRLGGLYYDFPIVSSNMKTVTEDNMSIAMLNYGGIGCLHRFSSIEDNVKLYQKIKEKHTQGINTWVSIGITPEERERANALIDAGAYSIVIDVAHGAQLNTVYQVQYLRKKYGHNIIIGVGNFATSKSIYDFLSYTNEVDFFKVGIGPSKICSTRQKTGIGIGQLSAILDCVNTNQPIIADGGCSKPADICKSLAAGAKMVMLGSMLASTDESPGEVIEKDGKLFKYHSGSADVGHGDGYRTSEGVTTLLPYKGSVLDILKDIEGGLRSSMTYVGAYDLSEYYLKTNFVQVTNTVINENKTFIE